MSAEEPFDVDAALQRFLAESGGASPLAPELPAPGLDWKQALLDEHGGPVRRRARRVTGPLQPPSAPPGWIPPLVDPDSIAARAVPLGRGERLRVRELRPLGEPPDELAGFNPGAMIPDAATHRAIVHFAQGPACDALEASIAEEPFFAYAAGRWRTAQGHAHWHQDAAFLEGNLELLHLLYDRLSVLMGAYFDFDPAPMVYMPEMKAGALGLYFPGVHVMAVASRLLGASLDEVVDTLAHEQAHAMQDEHKVHVLGLDPWHYSLARYWRAEDAKRRPGAFDTHLGTEWHARFIGRVVGQAFMALR